LSAALDLGFCWAFPGVTPEEGLRRLKACGFDGIELWPQALAEWGADRWQPALEETGMRMLQLCPYFDYVSGEAKVQSSRVMLQEYLALAGKLECNRLRVFTGPPWGEGVVGPAEATEEQWDSAIRELKRACRLAAAQGVELCLECHGGSLMEDSPSALRLIAGVGEPNLTVNLQIPFVKEAWETSLRELGSYTRHIHIHNWESDAGKGPLTFLGDGVFDWYPVVRYLLSLGHPLCLSVEHVDHGGRHDPWETARRDGAWLQNLRADLTSAF